MRKTSKIFSVIFALVLVFATVIPVMAVDITVNGGSEGSAYAAYKILNAESLGDGKYKYTLNEKYTDALKAVTEKSTEEEILAYIEALDADGTRSFADAVYEKISSLTADATVSNTETEKKFTGLDEGYWLIAETATGSDSDTISLVMLDTAGKDDITVTTKEGIPTVEKKVQDKNDTNNTTSDWQDSADYDIGDEITFKVTGTVSSKIADYTVYEYVFHDTMSAGLTYKTGSVKVMIGETDVTNSFKVEYVNNVLTVSCEDIKTINVIVNADSTVVLTYTATLNEDAVIGKGGNDNTVYLEYTNDPYYEGAESGEETPEDKTSKTEEDKVVIFTYKLSVDKIDEDEKALAGAGFTLYKKVNGAEVQIGEEITNVTTFTWTGLDDGSYVLKETTVPAGYNKADDISFTITATHDETSAAPSLTSLTAGELTVAEDFSLISTKVVNNSGNLLPSTGGIGTTIFYVAGAILVLGAVVLLITRKRVSA